MKELISKWFISIRCSKICCGYMVRNIKYNETSCWSIWSNSIETSIIWIKRSKTLAKLVHHKPYLFFNFRVQVVQTQFVQVQFQCLNSGIRYGFQFLIFNFNDCQNCNIKVGGGKGREEEGRKEEER